jgi:broad specificity phosphatase PhoE
MKLKDLEAPQRKWKEEIISEVENLTKPTIIFSHFMVINIIVSHLTKNDFVVSFYPDNCSITTLSKSVSGKTELISLGAELQTELN